MTRAAEHYSLVRQSYGIATAGNVFGGPTGVWLECTKCPASMKICGPDPHSLSDADAARVFRSHGWSGEGDVLKRAKCPKCAKAQGDGQ